MITNKNSVLVAGTLVLDIIPVFEAENSGSERAGAGGTVYLDKIRTQLGGSAGNTGMALHALGADVTIFSRVGKDSFGGIVSKLLQDTGCKQIVSQAEDLHTSASVVVAMPGQDRMILHSRGASQKYDVQSVPLELLEEKALFHFGYPTGMQCMYEDQGETLGEFFSRIKATGITTSLDTSFPGIHTPAGKADWKRIFRKTLPYTDIFMPSYEELFLMLRRDAYLKAMEKYPEMKLDQIFDLAMAADMADELLEYGVKAVVIKCGEKGAYLKTRKTISAAAFGRAVPADIASWQRKECFAPPFKVESVRSTNGAGDTFVAGFLQGVLLGQSPREALALAAGSAGLRISTGGDFSSLDTYMAIEKRISQGWPRMQADPGDPEWEQAADGLFYRKNPGETMKPGK